MRRFLPLLSPVLALGCTETGLTGITDVGEAGTCEAEAPAPWSVPVDETCRAEPVVGTFEPRVGWQWRDNPIYPGYHQIMAAPVVGHLNDDDGDGTIGEGDTPDVVFSAFAGRGYRAPGALVAVDGGTGETLWSVREVAGVQPYGGTGVAIADLGPGGPVVLTPSTGGLLAVEGADGTHRWTAKTPHHVRGHPAVADLDGDGEAEVILGATVVGADGTVRWTGTLGQGRSMMGSFAVDLDEDGRAEVIAGRTVYEADGTVRWDAGEPDLWPAVGDLDGDGTPEIIGTDGAGGLYVRDVDGVEVWSVRFADSGGGPPTIADFDGDGAAEIGVAGRERYRVFDGDGSALWANEVQDFSSRQTGSSVYDFEGDGAAEVVYADEETLWVYDGATGAVELAWHEHASGTLFEYPLVVDVDADGAAEIVLPSNDYSRPGARGITIIEDGSESWAPARTVWNQHAWSITNVRDDGTVPPGAPGNWTRWNSFRAGNSETAVGTGQPDLRIGGVEVCQARCDTEEIVEVFIAVENAGVGPSADVFLSVRAEDGAERLVLERIAGLQPGEMRWEGPFPLTAEQREAVGLLQATVDESDEVVECDEDDNVWDLPELACSEE